MTAWRKLDLPHDWGIEGPFRLELAGETGKLPWRGIGWYRKHFTVPADDAGKRVFLDFDGAMSHAKVWCNGQYVGTWPYGYSSFRMDLTPFLKFGGENVLAVRLDTENWDSRWYPGAGIYRHVWLVKTQPVHVGHWGTYVTTPEVTDASAMVKLEVTVDNQSAAAGQGGGAHRVLRTGRERPARLRTGRQDERGNRGDSRQRQARWSPSQRPLPSRNAGTSPRRTAISPAPASTVGGRQVDSYDTPFGIRTIEFTARDGFLLNGKRVPIQGVCNHHDLGALGAALNTRALERQLEILKEMGCNALRTSHNPPAPELLDLADRMGFLVMDEAFDCLERRQESQRLQQALRRMAREGSAGAGPPRPQPSVGHHLEHRQRGDGTAATSALTKHLADIMRARGSRPGRFPTATTTPTAAAIPAPRSAST